VEPVKVGHSCCQMSVVIFQISCFLQPSFLQLQDLSRRLNVAVSHAFLRAQAWNIECCKFIYFRNDGSQLTLPLRNFICEHAVARFEVVPFCDPQDCTLGSPILGAQNAGFLMPFLDFLGSIFVKGQGSGSGLKSSTCSLIVSCFCNISCLSLFIS